MAIQSHTVVVDKWRNLLLKQFGLPKHVVDVFCIQVLKVFSKVEIDHPDWTLDGLFSAIFGGFFLSMIGLFSFDQFTKRLESLGGVCDGDILSAVSLESSDLIVSSRKVFEEAEESFLKTRDMNRRLDDLMNTLSLFVVQEQQVFRKHYGVEGVDMSAVEILGNRVLREDLSEDVLGRLYVSLNEFVKTLKNAGVWLSKWDNFLSLESGLDLAVTRQLFGLIKSVLEVDPDAAPFLKLYNMRWEALDGRVLNTLVDKFCWKPLL